MEKLHDPYKKGQAVKYMPSVENMTLFDMLNMSLNHYVCGRHYTVMRVPGGWIYNGKQDIFVPEPDQE